MANLSGFDASVVEPTNSFEAIPAGRYLAMITASVEKPTVSGSGSYLELTFDIVDGQYRGRKVWARLNLNNPSDSAVRIARSELSAICRAVGVIRPQDSAELHNLPLAITVVCKKRTDTDEVANEIKGYAKKEEVLTRSVAPLHSPQSIDSTPPWQRK